MCYSRDMEDYYEEPQEEESPVIEKPKETEPTADVVYIKEDEKQSS